MESVALGGSFATVTRTRTVLRSFTVNSLKITPKTRVSFRHVIQELSLAVLQWKNTLQMRTVKFSFPFKGSPGHVKLPNDQIVFALYCQFSEKWFVFCWICMLFTIFIMSLQCSICERRRQVQSLSCGVTEDRNKSRTLFSCCIHDSLTEFIFAFKSWIRRCSVAAESFQSKYHDSTLIQNGFRFVWESVVATTPSGGKNQSEFFEKSSACSTKTYILQNW